MTPIERATIIVLDGVGVGALPDAAQFGEADVVADSLGHTAEAVGGLDLPHMQRLGLGNIGHFAGIAPRQDTDGAYGRMAEQSRGKDTVTGHWEMIGIVSQQAPPTYPHGFPPEVLTPFEEMAGRGVIGNKPASGTDIIAEMGDEHRRSGKLIVYTSGDSVFQIAAHEDIVPLPELYRICEGARALLRGPHAVGRVIARPFVGARGHYTRDNEARRDWALSPPYPHLLDRAVEAGLEVQGIGKIQDIFAGRSVTSSNHVLNNPEGIAATIEALKRPSRGIIFTNLIEFDMIYGHRKDPHGYARALKQFDDALPSIREAMGARDVLFVTGDHGVDPVGPGADHTREYVPLLVAGAPVRPGVDLGTRASFADLGATVAALLGLPSLPAGTSFAASLNNIFPDEDAS
jgi:phosphopentomutase